MFRHYGAVAAAAMFFAVTANTQSLAPIESRSIALGPLSGGVYYSVAPEGYRVVATLQSGTPSSIVRFIAPLAPGESVTLSTPRSVGEPPITVRIVRRGDQLLVANGRPRSDTVASLIREASSARVFAEAP